MEFMPIIIFGNSDPAADQGRNFKLICEQSYPHSLSAHSTWVWGNANVMFAGEHSGPGLTL